MLYLLLSSLLSYILEATLSEWMIAIIGMIVLFILAALVLAPGIYIVSRESIVANNKLGLIGKRRELLGLHTKGKILSLDDIEKVICRKQTRNSTQKKAGDSSGRTSSTTYYIIDLLLKDQQQAPLIEYKDKKYAKELARALAKFTGIELNDRL